MELLLNMISFHIFYYLAYILTWDVIKYHLSHNINIQKQIYKQIIMVILMPIIVFIILPILLKLGDIPFILRVASYFLIGIILTKDAWNMYEMKMEKYKDFYYHRYAKMDPFYIRNYSKNYQDVPLDIITKEKKQQILEFMKPYPYQLMIKRNSSINAYTNFKENQIVMMEGCLTLPIEEIKALLGHEIMHFQVDGRITPKNRKRNFFILLYLMLACFLPLAILFQNSHEIFRLVLLLLLCIFIAYFIFFHMVMPERYLYQLSELKCDRLACKLDGVSKDGMIALLNRLQNTNKKEEIWYLKTIRRYFLFADHPNLNYRIKKIEKYRNWSILDYMDLPIHLLIRLIIGKGWNDN